MTNYLTRSLILMVVASSAAAQGAPSAPKNFVYFGNDRERINDPAFLNNPAIAGAQLWFTWKELEPARDRYELQPVLDAVALLEKHGKRLFIQLQDVSFSENVLVPDYLRRDPEFNGGADRKFEQVGDNADSATFDGWVARRWDPNVLARFARLLEAMGQALDGRIEGVNTAETAIGYQSRRFHPTGFTFESYAAGIKELMTAGRRALPRSQFIVYANFMPGGVQYLDAIYKHADSIGVGVGGPDLRPHRWAQRNNSLPRIAARTRGTIAGLAVQDGNLADTNRTTGKRVTVEELYRYAVDQLRLDYIFWGSEEPYYSSEVLPFLNTLLRKAPTP